ncbi:MAG: hypothetical protein WCI20_10925, partial [bacterium]
MRRLIHCVWGIVFWMASSSASLAFPEWWVSRQVLVSNAPINDFAPVLQGQVRWLASNAVCELESKLPGGAGAEARHQIEDAGNNHFSAVNAGQLKQMATAIYRRLVEEGVVSGYPWTGEAADDYTPVNVGQTKRIFDFQVEGIRFSPSVNGTLHYSGAQTGLFQVVAYPVAGAGFEVSTTLFSTGTYHLVVGRVATRWRVEAWRDSQCDGLRQSWEATGAYALNPVVVTSVVSGIDLTLSDPDEDGDGIPGYVERQLGLDPYYPGDASSDADGDGLSLGDEYRYGSDPQNGDSDGNGMGDGAAVINGLSPTNGGSVARLPFMESFETPVLSGSLAGQNGWTAVPSGNAMVVTNPVLVGRQSLRLRAVTNGGVTVTHPLATHQAKRVWIDFRAVPVWRVAVLPGAPAASTVSSFYINQVGQVVVFDRTWFPGEWVVLTNTPGIEPGAAVRFTVQQDYVRRRWGLWLNGISIARNLPFSGSATELARLRFVGAENADSWLDEIAVTSNAPPGFVADSDQDGMPDDWERMYGLDPYVPSDAATDQDHDGLCNLEEYRRGLDPSNPDGDRDGWSDGTEVARGSSPTNADADASASIPFLEPFEPPAMPPGDIHGRHGWVAALSNWAIVQTSNRVEGLQALQLRPATNGPAFFQSLKGALGADVWTDWRAIPVRRQTTGRPVLSPVTTAAFYLDGAGYPVVMNGTTWMTLTNSPVVAETNWIRFTVHQDYSNRVWALYWDGRPVATNLALACGLTQYTGVRFNGATYAATRIDDLRITGSAPGDIDSDGDGMPNDWELLHGLNPSDASDGSELSDTDHDGLPNLEEYRLGLNPAEPDTDHDGMGDGAEIARRFSPTNTDVFTGIPFVESFEQPGVVPGRLAGQHGWRVTPTNAPACSQTNTVFEGRQALQWGGSAPTAVIHQPIGGRLAPFVWTDFRSIPVFRDGSATPVLSPASTVGFYVNGSGRIVVSDGTEWMPLTNHVPLQTQTWSRFTTCQDFSNRTWSLFLNGIPVATNLAMAHPVTEYSGFQATGSPYQAGFIDAITVTPNPPADIDSDGDGRPDDWRLYVGLDSDHDGMSDSAEVRLGYSPVLSNAFMRMPFLEDFETPAVTNGALGGQNGWVSERLAGALVQRNTTFEGTQALGLSSNGAVSHVVASSGAPVVWCDLRARPVFRSLEGFPVVGSNEASAFYINTTGVLVVCSGAAGTQRWEAVSGAGPVSTSQWIRLTVCLDYVNRTWSLWLAGVRVARDLTFANPVTEFCLTRISAPALSVGYLDQLAITTNEPPDLDDDGDGLPNAWERRYGLDPSDPDDGLADPDLDGLSNVEEYRQGTNPHDPDTDHDGLVDG